MSCSESNNSENSISNSSLPGSCLLPLPQHARKAEVNVLSSPPLSERVAPLRSFSSSDLQGTVQLLQIPALQDYGSVTKDFYEVSSLDLLMDAKPIIVGLEALRAYHSIDKALYAILVTGFWRDPVESLQIIALWIWLERVGFGKVTRKILTSAPLFINQTAEEAVMCLKCIKDPRFMHSAEAIDIPMTRSIIDRDISLQFFTENHATALSEVSRIINEDCLPTMRDIIGKALSGNAGASSSRSQILDPLNAAMSSSSNPTAMSFDGGRNILSSHMTVPSNASRRSLPTPIGPLNRGKSSAHNWMRTPVNADAAESSSNQMMNPANVVRRSLSNSIVMPSNAGQSSSSNHQMILSNASQRSLSNPNVMMPFSGRRRLESNQMMMSRHIDDSIIRDFSNLRIARNAFRPNNQIMNEVPPEDRTMFVTFSRGYPVAEAEVRHFFTTVFGNCIESFRMQEVGPYEQPLYARLVFSNASIIEEILNGAEKVKFSIDGKHVWMRKFVPRNSSS